MSFDFSGWMNSNAARIERALAHSLPEVTAVPAQLHEAMHYAVLQGGKRVRPMLVYAAGHAVGAPAAVLDAVACAVEMIHAYSLVHDDMPAMDNDVLRRGKPTVHVAYGQAQALLVGDALQSQAFDVLTRADIAALLPAPSLLAMVHTLACASGSMGMAGGQAIDLMAVGNQKMTQSDLQLMHSRKTGALLSAAVRMGALGGKASAEQLESLSKFATAIGLAFQVIDDVLDVESDTATLGKTAGKDAQNDKPTYVSLLGVEGARALAHTLRLEAIQALEALQNKGGIAQFKFSIGPEQIEPLLGLADLIVLRNK